jgi:hypothetical protein
VHITFLLNIPRNLTRCSSSCVARTSGVLAQILAWAGGELPTTQVIWVLENRVLRSIVYMYMLYT